MPDYIAWISQYTDFFPLAAFMALLLAGLSFPVSEDLVIITGALVCQGDPTLLLPTFTAIYAGVIISDYFPYLIGISIRKGTKRLQFLIRLFSPKNIDRMHRLLERYGIFTFIVCRFIPFGVRNTLFMSSGFFGLKLRRFALYDTVAAAISVSTLFFLTYYFGEAIKEPFRAVGIALFVLLISSIILIVSRIVRRIIRKRSEARKDLSVH